MDKNDFRRPSEYVANTQRSVFRPPCDADVDDIDVRAARANHVPQSHPTVIRSSCAERMPSQSSSTPSDTCTLLDGVAKKDRLNSKRQRFFSHAARWTLVDDSVSANAETSKPRETVLPAKSGTAASHAIARSFTCESIPFSAACLQPFTSSLGKAPLHCTKGQPPAGRGITPSQDVRRNTSASELGPTTIRCRDTSGPSREDLRRKCAQASSQVRSRAWMDRWRSACRAPDGPRRTLLGIRTWIRPRAA